MGNVGISNTTPAYKLDVSGTGNFTGTLTVGNLTPNWTDTQTTFTQTATLFGNPGTTSIGTYAGSSSGFQNVVPGVSPNTSDSVITIGNPSQIRYSLKFTSTLTSGFSSVGNYGILVTASCFLSVDRFTLVPGIYQMYLCVY